LYSTSTAPSGGPRGSARGGPTPRAEWGDAALTAAARKFCRLQGEAFDGAMQQRITETLRMAERQPRHYEDWKAGLPAPAAVQFEKLRRLHLATREVAPEPEPGTVAWAELIASNLAEDLKQGALYKALSAFQANPRLDEGVAILRAIHQEQQAGAKVAPAATEPEAEQAAAAAEGGVNIDPELIGRRARVVHGWDEAAGARAGDLAFGPGAEVEILGPGPGAQWAVGRVVVGADGVAAPETVGAFPLTYVEALPADTAPIGPQPGHEALAEMGAGVAALWRALDAAVVGHRDVKQAVLLALLIREHLYIEGPPGVAKTLTAEVAARATARSLFVYQFHRDTRLAELTGESVIVRERIEPAGGAPGGELIRQATRPGGVATAEISVLDDISRAPGEALNVLLRLLNERVHDGVPIPLLTAIATANPSRDDYYNEPLDPANLDRFTLQLRTRGLVHALGAAHDGARRHAEAAAVVDRFGGGPPPPRAAAADCPEVGKRGLTAGWELLPRVQLGEARGMLLELLRVLVVEHGCDDTNSLLTDRTWLSRAPKVLRAAALLAAPAPRLHCVGEDLHWLRLLATFRLPPEVEARFPAIVDGVIAKGRRRRPPPPPGPGRGASAPASGASEPGSHGASEPAAAASGSAPSSVSAGRLGGPADGVASAGAREWWRSSAASRAAEWRGREDLEPAAPREEAEEVEEREPGRLEESVTRLQSAIGSVLQALRGGAGGEPNMDASSVENMHLLLEAITGRQQRSSATRAAAAFGGGQPRRWRPSATLDELCDAASADIANWIPGDGQSPTPRLPRTLEREKATRGGALAIVRDISYSMSGQHTAWASSLLLTLLGAARQTRMRVGYVEFNDESVVFSDDRDGAFFGRDYARLEGLVRNLECDGLTNYEAPLADCLGAFGRPGLAGKRKHVLFLTDGSPTRGDKLVAAQRALARRLGVMVHTVFIGAAERYPSVLDEIARDTNGQRFQAVFDHQGSVVHLVDRARGLPPAFQAPAYTL
jgi:Mg-chelatase subunit ChlD